MYFLKNYLHSLFFTLLFSCIAIVNCNAQVDNNRNFTKPAVNELTECLTIYPNPADNQVMIKIPDDIAVSEPIIVRIVLLETKSIVEEIVIDSYRLLDTSLYPDGSYVAIPLIPDYICSGTRFQIFHK